MRAKGRHAEKQTRNGGGVCGALLVLLMVGAAYG
ncbi:MAG: hypothetical protein QOJ51_2842, partial [Acidobacteriaceae bacterium]|nr:hypothetical protein [Acidobacteriaceae bacterium]